MKTTTLLCLLPLLMGSLAACDRLGIPDPAKAAQAKEDEAKAIGGACRHAGRAIEDCYTLNPSAPKASIFAGWKEMNDYMAENKIETVKPELQPSKAAETSSASSASSADSSNDEDNSAAKRAARRRAARADSGAY